MSSRATRCPTDLGSRVIQQLAGRPTDSRSVVGGATDSKVEEIHESTTIIERFANTRRGYLAWLALQATSIIGKEPAIDSDAEASWRAR
jgi:hypothetical protein